MIRRTCEYKGCNKPGRNKGHYKGQTRYDRFCEVHHRARYNAEKRVYYYEKQAIPNTTCSSCGWDKAPCDRHRKVRAEGYVLNNIIVLCPNCHRLTHLGLL